ncbi:DNA (cytosine-5)-methyltransferase 1 [Eubacterium coprostanoligenes]|uniref:Cytosine-specific methyltransferase n=2 Tax=Eubacterium coprostanoligenes TaxID=290054 RepID=A0A1T4JTK6_9FIRM|nr:DNA (cytosine-5)-methyltransferase 1 [Eubacterium coprostanoligenes]
MYPLGLTHISDNMKVGSLFSGIGGIDLGFIQAGHEIAWANEIDDAAVKTYKNNFPETEIIHDDVRNIKFDKLNSVDLIAAGFPCQSFSIMGYQRGFHDSRGNLFFEITRAIDIIRPRYVFLENVKNLMYHDNGKTFLVIYNSLVQFGYFVKYKVIDAKDVNIPQNRARIFIVAFRDYADCLNFEFPEAVALEKTVDDIIDRSVKQEEIYYYKEDNRHYDELNRKVTSNGIYRIDDNGIATRKWEICPTLKANMGTYPDRVPIVRDDFGIRKLTLRECLDFQGFPESFLFEDVPMDKAYKQTGNTVCVPVIKRMAEKLNNSL